MLTDVTKAIDALFAVIVAEGAAWGQMSFIEESINFRGGGTDFLWSKQFADEGHAISGFVLWRMAQDRAWCFP